MTRYWGPMTLLNKLKALFGLGGDAGAGREAGVTVEREPSEQPTETGPTATETEPEVGSGASEVGGETAAESEPEPASEEAAESEPASEEAAEPPEEESEPPEGEGESLDVLSGIGPAYEERLADAGIDTVADLAGADAASLAGETDIGEKRLEGWIEAAEERLAETA